MRFDWKPESKERYFRKAEAAVKAAGFDDILRVDRDQFSVVKGTRSEEHTSELQSH